VTKNQIKFNTNHRDIPLGAFVRSIEQVSEFEYVLAVLFLQTTAEALRRHAPRTTLYRLLITAHNSRPIRLVLEYTLRCACDVGR